MRIILIRRLCDTGQNQKIYFGKARANHPPAGVIGDAIELSKNHDATTPVEDQKSVTTIWLGSAVDAFVFDDTGLALELDTVMLAPIYWRGNSRTSTALKSMHVKRITASSIVRPPIVYNDAPPGAVKSKRRGSFTTRMAISIRLCL